MKVEETKLEGVVVITPNVFSDHRGYFTETYNKKRFEEHQLFYDFIQDNHSLSVEKGTIRGIHYQKEPKAQTKLVRCTKGKILDIAVDLREDSETYKKWVSVELTEDNFKQLLIPKGFGHAFITLSDEVEVQYKVDEIYSPDADRSIYYDDPEIGILWPDIEPILSEKDANAPLLKDSDINF